VDPERVCAQETSIPSRSLATRRVVATGGVLYVLGACPFDIPRSRRAMARRAVPVPCSGSGGSLAALTCPLRTP
jgi:hypothetical protein